MRFPLLPFCLFLVVISTVVTINAQGSGVLFTVNSTADSVDATPGDGVCADANSQCTLRAAVQEANADTNVRDAIVFTLPKPSVIDLTLGEITISGSVAVVGPGARRLTVERSLAPGTAAFRIFRVMNNSLPGVEILGLKIRNGDAGGQNGGGIFVDQGNLKLTDVAITENKASSGGGIANTGVITISRCLLSSNTADNNGGGIYSDETAGGMQIFDSTITNNAAASGGAIHNNWGVTLANDTITSNTATENAQSIFNSPEGLFFRVLNTIIGNDNPSTVTSLSGTFFTAGNNIVTDARGSTGFTNGVNNDQISDSNAINPLLGDLADNGGQTDTRALQTGSPAIDAGNNCILTDSCSLVHTEISSDQRGFLRPVFGGTIDIGSFEANAGGPLAPSRVGFLLSHGAFYVGAVAVLTGATSGRKIYKPISPLGHFGFDNLGVELYVLEIRVKRPTVGFFPLVISFEDSPPFSFAPEGGSRLDVQVNDNRLKQSERPLRKKE